LRDTRLRTMMVELIVLIIFLVGLIGMGVIIVRKIPVLTELSPQEIEPSSLKKLGKKIKDREILKSFSKGILLQKILSKVRILTLKTDNKTSTWLMKLRQKSAKKKNNFSDDYWEKVNPHTKRSRSGVGVKKGK